MVAHAVCMNQKGRVHKCVTCDGFKAGLADIKKWPCWYSVCSCVLCFQNFVLTALRDGCISHFAVISVGAWNRNLDTGVGASGDLHSVNAENVPFSACKNHLVHRFIAMSGSPFSHCCSSVSVSLYS